MSYNMNKWLNKEKTEYTPVPNGHYEVTITSVKKTTVAEKPVVNITYKVRNDVEQECKGRLIFDTIWEDSKNPGEYDSVKIGRIFTFGFDTNNPDVKKFYEEHDDNNPASIDDLIQFLSGMDIGVDTEMKTTPTGKQVQRIKKYSCAVPRTSNASDAIDDEDLPF